MAKYYDAIGYTDKTEEVRPGVHEEKIVERFYTGDVIKNTRRLENSEHIIDDLNVRNTISILADAYAFQNFFAIRYATWMGVRWKVETVEVQSPRLLLTLGGVYNGPTP